jgi:hypothetical protein
MAKCTELPGWALTIGTASTLYTAAIVGVAVASVAARTQERRRDARQTLKILIHHRGKRRP